MAVLAFKWRAILFIGGRGHKDNLCARAFRDRNHASQVRFVVSQDIRSPVNIAMIVDRANRVIENLIDLCRQ